MIFVEELSRFSETSCDPVEIAGITESAEEYVAGYVVSKDGFQVRAGVTLRPETSLRRYSHVGELKLPKRFFTEFIEAHPRPFFYPDSGESFDEIHMVEEIGEEGALEDREAIVMVLRGADDGRLA